MEPPTKKAKTENLNEFIKSVQNSDKNLTPVLRDDLYERIPTVSCHVGHIKDKKLLSNTIQVLNERVPLKNLQHLKRVTRDGVLLCSEDFLRNSEYENIQDLIEHNAPELRDSFDYFKLVSAASQPPLTKSQNTECKKKWPCNFHPNPYIEELLSGEFFNNADLTLHRKYMAITLHIAQWHMKDNFIAMEQDLLNAAVVVNSKLQSIVAISFDNRANHPTQHSAMIAIDNVAKTQHGGVWTGHIENELIENLKSMFKVEFGPKQYKQISKKENGSEAPYLCTGYDIYLIREPCLMCAMGLLHARVKRVFYLYENKVQGALKTKTKLHCLPGLNHRYEVFTGFDV